MYRYLEAEIVRKNIRKQDLAKVIGKSYNTLLSKLRGSSPLTYDEAEIIQRKYFPEIALEILFAKEQPGA